MIQTCIKCGGNLIGVINKTNIFITDKYVCDNCGNEINGEINDIQKIVMELNNIKERLSILEGKVG